MPPPNNNNDAFHGQLAYGLIPVNLITELLRPTTYVLGLLLPLLIGYFVYPFLVAYMHVSQPTLKLTSESSVEADVVIDTTFDVWRTITRNNLLSVLWSQTKEMTKPVVVEVQAPHTFHSAVGMFFSAYFAYFAGLFCVVLCGIILFAGMWVQQRIMLNLDANRHAILRPSPSPSRITRSASQQRQTSSTSSSSSYNSCDADELSSATALTSLRSTSASAESSSLAPLSLQKEAPAWTEVVTTDYITFLNKDGEGADVPSMFSFIAKSGTGKSTIVQSLLYQYRDFFQGGIVITGSKENNDFNGIIDDVDIWDSWDADMFTERYNQMRAHQLRERAVERSGGVPQLLPPTFVIFDDCMGELGSRVPPIFDKFMSKFRHLNIWVFFSTQIIRRGLPTIIQTQTNYTFLMRQRTTKDYEIMYKTFGSDLHLIGGKERSWTYKEFLEQRAIAEKQKYHCLFSIATLNLPLMYRTFTASPCPRKPDVEGKLRPDFRMSYFHG
jgi:hypothetical protein